MIDAALNRRALLAASLGLCAGGAFAQSTDGVVAFIVPQPAGNSTDGTARKALPVLQKALGQTVVVENFPGAGGSIGVAKTLTVPGDGLAMVIGSQTELILTPLSIAGARYKPEDFRLIALTGITPYLLVARADLPVNSVRELVALARQNPSKPLAFGHIGNGTLMHLMGEQMGRKLNIPLTQVPYKGVPPMVQDLMGGQIDLTMVPIAGSTVSLVETGKIKAIGPTATAPHPMLQKAAPLARQDDALKDFVYSAWGGVLVPAKTSPAATQRLYKAFLEVLGDAEVKAWSAGTGVKLEEPRPQAELDQFYRGEIKLYQQLARDMGVTPQ